VIIPNGEITRIANFNRGFTRAIVEVGIAYEEDVDRAIQVLQNIASQYREANPSKILEEPTIHRIARLDSSAVILRVILKVAPKEHWGVERDLLYLIKKTFDEEKIEIPYQKHVVFMKDLR
jgi:small conductance mechanosensitive channel